MHRFTLRRRAIRFATAALLVIGIGGAGVLVSATPALATTCYFDTCTGKDPHATGCDASYVDTINASSRFRGSFSVEMRRSLSCLTAWGRVTVDDYLPTCCNGIRARLVAQNLTLGYYYTTYVYTRSVGAGLEGRWWTQMVSLSATRLQLCYEYYNMETGAGYGYSPEQCGAWFYP